MYYYTSRTTHRRSRASIDIGIIAVSIIIVILFAGILFWQGMRDILFPSIFGAGAVVNILSGLKQYYLRNKKAVVFLGVVSLLLIGMAITCLNIEVGIFR